jgi:hypothetical protein
MSGIYYGLAVLGVLWLIHWYVTNDGAKPGESAKGFFAMRDPSDKEKARAEKLKKKKMPPPRWTLPGRDR